MAPSRNLIPKVSLALVVGFFVYGWFIAGSSATGGPIEVLGIPGAILLCAAILGTLATIVVAAIRAHSAGSWLWLVVVILVWPLSYVYALVINRHG